MIEKLRARKKDLLLFAAAYKRKEELEAKLKEPSYIVTGAGIPNPYINMGVEEMAKLSADELAVASKIAETNIRFSSAIIANYLENPSLVENKINVLKEKTNLVLSLIGFAVYLEIDPQIIHKGGFSVEGENQFDKMTTADMINSMEYAMLKHRPLLKTTVSITPSSYTKK